MRVIGMRVIGMIRRRMGTIVRMRVIMPGDMNLSTTVPVVVCMMNMVVPRGAARQERAEPQR